MDLWRDDYIFMGLSSKNARRPLKRWRPGHVCALLQTQDEGGIIVDSVDELREAIAPLIPSTGYRDIYVRFYRPAPPDLYDYVEPDDYPDPSCSSCGDGGCIHCDSSFFGL